MELPRSLPLGSQNRELLVASGIGDGRFDGGYPRFGRPLGAPGEKGLDCRRVAFDVDQDRAVRLVADPTREPALACLARCRRSVVDTLHRARDASNDAHSRGMCHADSPRANDGQAAPDDAIWHIGTRYVSDLAFAAARPMARSMRDREIMRNGVWACAGVIQLAPVPARNGKVEKGGAWLEFSSDLGHGRSGA